MPPVPPVAAPPVPAVDPPVAEPPVPAVDPPVAVPPVPAVDPAVPPVAEPPVPAVDPTDPPVAEPPVPAVDPPVPVPPVPVVPAVALVPAVPPPLPPVPDGEPPPESLQPNPAVANAAARVRPTSVLPVTHCVCSVCFIEKLSSAQLRVVATESMLRTGGCAAGVSNVRAVRNPAEDATIDRGQTSCPTSRLLQSSGNQTTCRIEGRPTALLRRPEDAAAGDPVDAFNVERDAGGDDAGVARSDGPYAGR